MRFLKDRLIREIGWIAFLVSSETQNLMNLTIDPTADSSDSPRRLISLPDQRYFPLPWKRSAKYISGSFEFPKWNASPPQFSSILYIGRIVVLRSLVTILFHPWAWIRGLGERDSNLSVPAADVNLGGRLTTKRVEILPVIVDERWK